MKTDMSSTGGLNTETTIALSQSMDSVHTATEEEVRTLFVSGLPMDTKPRELYLLFRTYEGYENALLKVMGKPGKNNTPSNGYEGSLLKVTNKNGKNTSPVGFVTFNSRKAAEAAKADLQGVRFDPDLPQLLRLEFAKSNTKVTKPKQQSPQPAAPHPTLIHPLTGQELGAATFIPAAPEAWAPHPIAAYTELAPNAAAAATLHHHALIQHPALAQVPYMGKHPLHIEVPYSAPSYIGPSRAEAWLTQIPQDWYQIQQIHHPLVASPSAVSAALPHPQLAATPILNSPISTLSTSVASGTSANSSPLTTSPFQVTPNSTPCSTLFVANLGQFCSEQELKDLFGSFQGFNRLKMHNKGGSPVAFVEFQDVKQAVEAKTRLQGFIMLSSERGGLRIEYAKTKMGEVNGHEFTPIHSPIPIIPNLAL